LAGDALEARGVRQEGNTLLAASRRIFAAIDEPPSVADRLAGYCPAMRSREPGAKVTTGRHGRGGSKKTRTWVCFAVAHNRAAMFFGYERQIDNPIAHASRACRVKGDANMRASSSGFTPGQNLGL